MAENSAPIGEWYGLSKAEIKIGGLLTHFREKIKKIGSDFNEKAIMGFIV